MMWHGRHLLWSVSCMLVAMSIASPIVSAEERPALPQVIPAGGFVPRFQERGGIVTISDSEMQWLDDETAAGLPGSYFAVMGQVAYPGVYQGPYHSMPASVLIEQAGGLTTAAAGTCRIIRSGRPVEGTLSVADAQTEVLAGDVLVIESDLRKNLNQHIDHAGGANPNQAATGDEPRQLAVVGLAAHPVVLKVRRQHANLPALAELLGQDGTAVTGTTVIHALARRTVDGAPQDPSAELPDGSVIVFDPAVVHPESLPPLPAPYQFAFAEEMRAILDDEPNGLPGELPEDGALLDPPGQVHIVSPESPLPPPPEAVDLPEYWLDDSPPAYSEMIPAPLPRDLEAVPAPAEVGEMFSETSSPAGPAEVTQSSGRFAGNAVTIIIAVVLLAAGRLLWSMARLENTAASAESRVASHSRLKKLIQNELAVTEEPLPLPRTSTFFGQPQGPQHIRIDAAETLRGPHMRPTASVVASRTGAVAEGRQFQSVITIPDDGDVNQTSAAAHVPEAQADSSLEGEASLGRQIRADASHGPATARRPAAAKRSTAVDRALSNVQGVKPQ